MAKVKQVNKVKNTTGSLSGKGKHLDTRWYYGIIMGFCLLIYSNAVFNDYNMDDELVTQNHRLTSKGISAIPEIFNSPYYADEAGYKFEYRPVVLVTFAIEHSFFGENPHVSHFINILLYGFLCVLLFVVLRLLLKQFNPLFALLATLVFAAHPIHTEVVASIKNRDEILSLIFGLFSLLFAVKYVIEKRFAWFILVPLLFVAGIFSKSTIISFSVIIPLTLLAFTPVSFRSLMALTVCLALPAVFYARLYSLAQQLLLVIGLLGSVVFFYFLKNSLLTGKNLIAVFKHNYATLFSENEEPEKLTPVSLDFSFIKNKLVLLATISLVVVGFLVPLYGLYLNDPWFSVLPVLFLSVIVVLVRSELKLILITPFTIVTLYALSKFNYTHPIIEAGYVVFMAVHFLSGGRTFRIVSGVNYLLFIIFSITVTQSYFFVNVFVFAVFLNRRLWPVTALLLLYSLTLFPKQMYFLISGVKQFNLSYLSFPVVYAGLFLVWRGKDAILRWGSTIAIPVFIALCFIASPPTTNDNVVVDLKRNYYKMNTVKAADITPIQTVRPFGYMESPVTVNDPLNVKLGTAMVVLGKYLKLIVLPYPMSYYYGYAYIVPTSFFQLLPIIILLVHFVLLLLAIFLWHRALIVSFSILFYLVSISIFSGLVSTVPGMMGDRFLFIPSIGFCLLLAYIIAKATKQEFMGDKTTIAYLSPVFKVTSLGLLLIYSLITFSRNSDWENRLTLFRKDIKAVENSAQAQNLLGVHLLVESNKETNPAKQQEMRQEATGHFKRAVEIYPKFLNASFDLGRAYMMLQKTDSAYLAFEQARHIDTGFVIPCLFMAGIQQERGNLAKAAIFYETYLSKYPNDAQATDNLSFVYFKLGEPEKSIQVKKNILQLNPANFDYVMSVAQSYLQMGQRDSALTYLKRAAGLRPTDMNLLQQIQTLEKVK